MSELADALDRSRAMISAALTEARAELEALDARRSELEALISQGEAALGYAHPPADKTASMTLHEAVAQILRENGNTAMTARALADEVNDRGLYLTRDGGPVEVNQIHARTNNYQDIFEKQGSLIRLKEESPILTGLPQAISMFRDDDRGFFQWLDDHPDGYFLNSERNPKPTHLVLHRPSCPHFDRGPVHWTRNYVKICSSDRSQLEEWASGAVGGNITLCDTCFGQASSPSQDHPLEAVAMPETLQNWRLILQAARALTAAGQTPFTRIGVYEWIWRRYPQADHGRPSLDPTFQGMTKNATGGPPSACGTPLIRTERGLYILAE